MPILTEMPRTYSPLTRIAVGFVAIVAPIVAIQWLIRQLPLPRVAVVSSAALLGAAVACLAYGAYVRRVERRELLEFAPEGALKELTTGLAFGAALLASTIGVLAFLGTYRVTGVGSPSDLVTPLCAAIMAGVAEEIVFRGVIFRIAEQWLGTLRALAISAVLFGLIHLVGPRTTLYAAAAIIFEAGILLAAAFMLTRRLWLCIGMHIGWNFTQGGIFGTSVSGTPSRGLLRGTLTGENWLTDCWTKVESRPLRRRPILRAVPSLPATRPGREHEPEVLLPCEWIEAAALPVDVPGRTGSGGLPAEATGAAGA